MGYIPDNYDRFKQHDADVNRRISRLPICDCCGEHIRDDSYYCVRDINICLICLDDFKVWNDD